MERQDRASDYVELFTACEFILALSADKGEPHTDSSIALPREAGPSSCLQSTLSVLGSVEECLPILGSRHKVSFVYRFLDEIGPCTI